MTRNEFIAETAARYGASDATIPDAVNITHAEGLADALEARGIAPWLKPPAPALTDAARRVVEAAVEWNAAYESTDDNHALRTRVALSDAVNAYKESAK